MTDRITSLSTEAKVPEDLSVLERRGALNDADRRRLKMALAASDTLACTHGLGYDFDTLDTQCAGDSELLARVVACTKARYCRPMPVRTRSRLQAALPWLASISLLLVAMAAGATLWPLTKQLLTEREGLSSLAVPSSVRAPNQSPWALGSVTAQLADANAPLLRDDDIKSGDHLVSASEGDGARPSSATTSSGNDGAKSRHRVAPASKTDANEHVSFSTPDVATTPRPNQSASARLTADLRRDSTGAGNASQPSSVGDDEKHERTGSASELFREANVARRQGDTQRARSLYAALRHAYPAASETALSCVIVGRMDLQVGAAPDALRQFEQYLRLAPAGTLVEEALAGKAAAYRELSRPADESATWRALLSRYPDSVYAGAARKRLEELR